ncbi:MAG: YigZ family protein [Clostridia bacterium]|nr:YigZ family protein [Clostridia bacterium]
MEYKGYITVGAGRAEFTERRSEFIGSIAPVTTEEEAREFVRSVSSEFSDATHNVYCYILRENNTVRFSDAGEPSGTAGRPALEVLQREGVTDVALVITRYFGGILLGAGGLVRAYAASAKAALDAGGRFEMRPAVRLRIEADYSDHARISAFLGEPETVEYGEKVVLTLLCAPEEAEGISVKLLDMTAGRVKAEQTEVVLRPIRL